MNADASPFAASAASQPYATSAVEPKQPPVPPHESSFGAHETKFCGARSSWRPVESERCDSSVAVLANAQHEPH